MVWRASVVAVAVGLLAQAQAFDVTLVNSCSESIDVFDSKTTETLQVGGTSTRTVSPGGAYVYRKGTGGQATLAEFSADNSAAWFDISIIPTGEGKGPGNCGSLEECKAVTGGVGFNVAMSIEPSQTDGHRCVALTCMEDGCSDGYQYPADDTKTHSCSSSVDFIVTFCPGGSGGAIQQVVPDQVADEAENIVQYIAPTEAPTSEAPVTLPPTETPSTQPPATEAPSTQAPTTQPPMTRETPMTTMPSTMAPITEAPATQPPTEAPVASSASASSASASSESLPSSAYPSASNASSSSSASTSSDVDAGDSQWNDFVGKVGAHNETSNSSSGSNDVDVGDDSGSSSKSTSQTSDSPKHVSYEKAGVQTSAPSAVQATGDDGLVEQANTQSSGGSDGGATYIVLSIGAAVGLVAVAAIVVIRKKKQAFDDMDSKTPAHNMDHNVLMTATNTTSTVL